MIQANQIEIGRHGPEAAGRLAALYAASVGDMAGPPWRVDTIEILLADSNTTALVATVPEKTGPDSWSGFAIGRSTGEEGELLMLGVLPEARRRGVGRHLVAGVARWLRSAGAGLMFLEVAEDNEAAITLYQAMGFAPVGRRERYYRRSPTSTIAALVMRAELPLIPNPDEDDSLRFGRFGGR
ncbi:MAG: GNAT family N-acetyltransferase [Sphingomonadales bacterium]